MLVCLRFVKRQPVCSSSTSQYDLIKRQVADGATLEMGGGGGNFSKDIFDDKLDDNLPLSVVSIGLLRHGRSSLTHQKPLNNKWKTN